MEVQIKSPAECTLNELEVFEKLVVEGGEVVAYGLRQRIRQAEALIFICEAECLAVGAIKNPNNGYKARVFDKAGVTEGSGEYTYELGWLYVAFSARGRGFGHELMRAVTKFLDNESCYATTRVSNDSMHHLFSQYNFKRLGSTYQSDNGYSLVLYASKP